VAALDYAAQGVCINAIAPGPILTERLQVAGRRPAEGRDGGAGAPARPAGGAPPAPEHAAFVTGLTLTVDDSITTGCRRPTR
jgi:NAD(P)-dependent dehydrogenase (short-subunit alcohol dehydrogenase family)